MTVMIATFSIWSGTFHGNEVSKILNMPADSIVDRGVNRLPPQKYPQQNGWHVSVRKNKIVDMSDLLEELIFGRDIKSIDTSFIVANDDSCKIVTQISVNIENKSTKIPSYIEGKYIKILASLNSDFDIDYF